MENLSITNDGVIQNLFASFVILIIAAGSTLLFQYIWEDGSNKREIKKIRLEKEVERDYLAQSEFAKWIPKNKAFSVKVKKMLLWRKYITKNNKRDNHNDFLFEDIYNFDDLNRLYEELMKMWLADCIHYIAVCAMVESTSPSLNNSSSSLSSDSTLPDGSTLSSPDSVKAKKFPKLNFSADSKNWFIQNYIDLGNSPKKEKFYEERESRFVNMDVTAGMIAKDIKVLFDWLNGLELDSYDILCTHNKLVDVVHPYRVIFNGMVDLEFVDANILISATEIKAAYNTNKFSKELHGAANNVVNSYAIVLDWLTERVVVLLGEEIHNDKFKLYKERSIPWKENLLSVP